MIKIVEKVEELPKELYDNFMALTSKDVGYMNKKFYQTYDGQCYLDTFAIVRAYTDLTIFHVNRIIRSTDDSIVKYILPFSKKDYDEKVRREAKAKAIIEYNKKVGDDLKAKYDVKSILKAKARQYVKFDKV